MGRGTPGKHKNTFIKIKTWRKRGGKSPFCVVAAGVAMVSNKPLMAEQLCPSESDKLLADTRSPAKTIANNTPIIITHRGATEIDLFHMMKITRWTTTEYYIHFTHVFFLALWDTMILHE